MKREPVFAELSRFFRAARHLWGRCPRCGDVFRLSDAAISFGSTPPRDWLLRLQRQQERLDDRSAVLEDEEASLRDRENQLQLRERDIARRERDVAVTARTMAKEMVRSESAVRSLLKEARQQAAQRSRSTLLGKLFERLGPVLQRFGHDPRDMRPIMDPIDYVVFKGLTVNRRVERITFLEVKSGLGRQSSCQRSIAQAIRAGSFDVETLQIGDRDLPIGLQLLRAPGADPCDNASRSKA
jgi:predicted Holliday junction resolvase-like endonuclease